jgi:hypothetical protein
MGGGFLTAVFFDSGQLPLSRNRRVKAEVNALIA